MVDSNNGTIKKKKVVVKKKTETSPRIKDISETEFDELDIKPKSRVRRKSSTSNTSEKSFKFDSIEKEEPIEEIKPIETKNNNIDLTTKLKNFRNNRKRRVVEVEREVPSVTKVLKAELEVEKETPKSEKKVKRENAKSIPEPKKEVKKEEKKKSEVKKTRDTSTKAVKVAKEPTTTRGKKEKEVVNKETAKTKKSQRTKKEDLTDILFTPNPRTKNVKKEVKEEKETKKNPTKTSEAKKKSKNKVVKARKIDMDDSYVDTKSKRVLKPKVSKVFTILSDILYWVIFIFIVVLLFIVCVQRFSNNELSIGGIRIYNVSTESMASKYAVGDIILAKDVDPSTLRVGDDIAYNGKGDQLEGKIITHEIQSISQNEDNSYTIITKGIENDIEDPAINSSQIKGKIIRKLPILSAISRVASNNFGLFFAIFIPVAVIIFINMIRIMNASDEEE